MQRSLISNMNLQFARLLLSSYQPFIAPGEFNADYQIFVYCMKTQNYTL